MSTSQKNKNKTGIPIMKVTTTKNSGEVTTASSRSQSQQSDNNNQNRMNRPYSQGQQVEQHLQNLESPPSSLQNVQSQQLSLQSKSKVLNKKHLETWADEVIQSQSQKLNYYFRNEAQRRQEDMEKHLKDVEAQLVTMSNLLEQREKAVKEAAEKVEDLEHKLHDQDCYLIKHGIDPVTGEQINLNEEEEVKVESNKKLTKKKVQEMRTKLKQMNNQAESYLSDIEKTLQYLNSLELASERAGQLSEGFWGEFGDNDRDEIIKMSENYDKLADSGVTFITTLAPDESEILNENCEINFSTNDGDNAELSSYDAICKRFLEEMDNGGDKNTNQDAV